MRRELTNGDRLDERLIESERHNATWKEALLRLLTIVVVAAFAVTVVLPIVLALAAFDLALGSVSAARGTLAVRPRRRPKPISVTGPC
jgi:hypothetical protein